MAALLLGLVACKKTADDADGKADPPLPIITVKGAPAGAAVTRDIGPAGGQLQSADGAISINIPAGALSANTPVGIQPISNEAPLGIGKGYRLTPEGTTFARPVTITMKYESDSLINTASDFLWIASQAADGSWVGHRKSVVDVNARTVSVQTTHFSDWVIGVFLKMSLSPAAATIKVKENISLSITGFNGDYEDEELVPLSAVKQSVDKLASRLGYFTIDGWTLNGANAPVGNAAGSLQPATGNRSATYTAPDKAPSQNPVAVAVSLTQKQIGGPSGRFTLVSHIRVQDKYFARFAINGVETVFSGAEIFDGISGGTPGGNIGQAAQAGGTLTILLKSNARDIMVSLGFGNPRTGTFSFFNTDHEDGVQVSYFKLSAQTSFLSTYNSVMYQLVKDAHGNCGEGASSSGTVTVTEYKDENGAVITGSFSGTIWNIGDPVNCSNTSVQISGEFAMPLFKP